ncbi:MAG: hypothetical protein ACXIUM_15425 [Wenzhouxiangella sp.]
MDKKLLSIGIGSAAFLAAALLWLGFSSSWKSSPEVAHFDEQPGGSSLISEGDVFDPLAVQLEATEQEEEDLAFQRSQTSSASTDPVASTLDEYDLTPESVMVMNSTTRASDLITWAEHMLDRSHDLHRYFGGTAIQICNWSESDFDSMLADGYFPDSARTHRSLEYILSRLEPFCHGFDAIDADDILAQLIIDGLQSPGLVEEWIALRQTGAMDQLFQFIETRLAEATYAARFISDLSTLNSLASDIGWTLGAQHTGLAFVRMNTLTHVRALAADMLWCDFYGGCGAGEAVTLRECMTYMVCDTGVTLADIWDMRFGIAEIEGARRLADELKDHMPTRPFP